MAKITNPSMIDPVDKRKERIADEMVRAADDKAHRDEAVWLLTHIEMHPRYEENREWFERWQGWLAKEMANR